MTKQKRKNNILIFISFICVALGSTLIVYRITEPVIKERQEKEALGEFYKNEIILEQNQGKETKEEKPKEEKKETNKLKYIAVLKIPKIKLEKGLYERCSKYNSVDYGIEILESSDSPEKENGNVILAAHAGNSSISYFKNLELLSIGDFATIIYNGKTYNYEIVDIYEVEKTGTVPLKRKDNISTLTLITCKHKTNKQIVLIGNLHNSI